MIAFGSGSGSYTWALIGAAAALVLIGTAGILARATGEAARRTLKFGVGGLLTAFGTFWSSGRTERALARWRSQPGLAVPGLSGVSFGALALARAGALTVAAMPQGEE